MHTADIILSTSNTGSACYKLLWR